MNCQLKKQFSSVNKKKKAFCLDLIRQKAFFLNKKLIFRPALVNFFQLRFVIEISRIVVIFGSHRAAFNAGAALDADARHVFGGLRIDGAHWTDCGAIAAMRATVSCQRFYFADVD